MQSTQRPQFDPLITAIADYVAGEQAPSERAIETAGYCLADSLGCAFRALRVPACTKLLGPVIPGALVRGAARVPGTGYELDPVTAAFNIGILIRWLDFNDAWLAAEWGHPSDNLGGLLATADYLSRAAGLAAHAPLSVRSLLHAMIKAYEIQGVLALDNRFNHLGLDHVLLVRIATSAVVSALLGASRDQICNAVSNAWVDGGPLRIYRHAPNVGSRKSWAAGDATSRGVWHALLALRGEMGYSSALSAKTWGFQDVLFRGQSLSLPQPLGCYVMENVLFNVAYPAQIHAQTAVEAALALHPEVAPRLGRVARVVIETQDAALRILDKSGPLLNAADRDHCLQYLVAVPLIFGRLTASDYEQEVAADPRIDALRAKTQLRENPDFTRDCSDMGRRCVGNAVQVHFDDGSSSRRVAIDCPIGHPRRRAEAIPLLQEKLVVGVRSHFPAEQARQLIELLSDRARLEKLAVSELLSALVLA